jgi:predicted DNA-binding transcriptional regulator AlpA
MHEMTLLAAKDVATLLSTSPQVIYNPAWRRRVSLPAVRVGRSLRFKMADIDALIQRGTETLASRESANTQVKELNKVRTPAFPKGDRDPIRHSLHGKAGHQP